MRTPILHLLLMRYYIIIQRPLLAIIISGPFLVRCMVIIWVAAVGAHMEGLVSLPATKVAKFQLDSVILSADFSHPCW